MRPGFDADTPSLETTAATLRLSLEEMDKFEPEGSEAFPLVHAT